MICIEVDREAIEMQPGAAIFQIEVRGRVDDRDLVLRKAIEDLICGGVISPCFLTGKAKRIIVPAETVGVEDELDGATFLVRNLTNDPDFDSYFVKGVHHFGKVGFKNFSGRSVRAFPIGNRNRV